MKTRFLISLAMAALLTTACSNENEELAPNVTKGILKVSVEGNHRSSTRAGFDAGGKFYWSKGDKLGVTTKSTATTIAAGETGDLKFTSLTLDDACAGQASGTFEGGITEGTEIGDYAVYPYSDKHYIDGNGNLCFEFPASYAYTRVDQDYFTETQGTGNSFNPAMCGKIENGSVQLKHLGGVFCIKIKEMPVASGTLSLVSNKQITGTFSTDMGSLDNTSGLASAQAASGENGTVSITFSGATVGQPGVFYVPVPTGTFEVRIKVSDGSTEKINTVAGTYAVNRRDLKKIELTSGSIDASGAPKKTSTLADAATALGGAGTEAVSVEESISGTSNEISIPGVSGSETATTKSLSLEKVESGTTLTVKDGNSEGSSTSSVENFTLSIPNNESTEFTAPLDVTIQMPNTTVTLAGNGGTAKYGTVTAETASNTLVISSGVEVNKVVVSKGNIRVNRGAKLTEIERAGGNTAKVIIYKEENAIIPESLDAAVFEVVDAVVADLQKVAAKGGTYDLNTDVTGDFIISATSDVTINLNGHKITNKAGDTFTVNFGSKLIINGTGTVDNISHGKACIYNNGTVELNGGTYTRSKENGISSTNAGGNSYYNILNHGVMTIKSGVTVEQSGNFSSMIANGYYNYGKNTDARSGYVEGTNCQVPSLSIMGGTFSGGLNTIKNDDNGTLTISEGTFTNTSQATIQNHHVATISNGTFNSDGNAKYVIDNCACGATYDKGIMNIQGGSFTGKIYSHGSNGVTPSMTVSGGTFSDPSATNYVADNASVNICLEKDIDLSSHIVVKRGNVTLNLNRHKIYNSSDIWDNKNVWSLISVQGGSLTINGEGEVAAKENDCYAVDVREGATLTIENGKYIGNIHAVYVNKGLANIKGGEYSIQQTYPGTEKPYEFVLNCYDANYEAQTANVVVTGGTFHKFNPAKNGAEGAVGSTNFCATGYTSTTSDNGETWVVALQE